MLDKAISIAKKAAEDDGAGNHRDAMNGYNLAVQHFVHSIKYDNLDDQRKKMIYEKSKEYLARAEELSEILKTQSKEPIKTTNAGADEEFSKIKAAISRAILHDNTKITWDDIAGLVYAKQALQEAAILPTKFPQLFSETRRPWKGILLFGPPGTGKTQLAKAVAHEACNATFIYVTSADLTSKWLGESEKYIKALFEVAREQSPSVIFIDEIDSVCSSRSDNEHEATRRVKTEIITQMQGVKEDTNRVLVLGATNNPWILDSAIRRRFEKRIYIPLPDKEARKELLNICIKKILDNVPPNALETFASMTNGYSGHDIVSALNEANMEPVRKVQHATHFKRITAASISNPQLICNDMYTPCSPGDKGAAEMTFREINPDKLVPPVVTLVDIKSAISRTKPSVSKDDLTRHEEFMKEFGMGG